MPQKLNTVFVSNEKVNNILNYKPQDTFRCLEVVYNSEVMEVLTNLDPLIPNYNKIPDALYPQNIQYLKTIKAFTKKEGHIVDYAKSCIKRGRYTIRKTMLHYQGAIVKLEDYFVMVISRVLMSVIVILRLLRISVIF